LYISPLFQTYYLFLFYKDTKILLILFIRHKKKIIKNEICFDAAKKYKNKSEFNIKNRGAFKSALRNGWLNEIYYDQK
jgi:hypothetical protein